MSYGFLQLAICHFVHYSICIHVKYRQDLMTLVTAKKDIKDTIKER